MIQISYSAFISPGLEFTVDTNNRFKKYKIIIKQSFPVRLDDNQISFHDDIPDMYVNTKVIVEFGFSLFKIWKTYDVIFQIEHNKIQYVFLDFKRQKPFDDFCFELDYDINKTKNSEKQNRILDLYHF